MWSYSELPLVSWVKESMAVAMKYRWEVSYKSIYVYLEAETSKSHPLKEL